MSERSNLISSIMQGTDAEIIPRLVRFYSGKEQPEILDATYGKGRFWTKSNFKHLVGIDIDPRLKVPMTADYNDLPFARASFDIVIFDPPHIVRACNVDALDQSIYAYYNLVTASNTYKPFLIEAFRVLREGGFVIAKIADEVRLRKWNHVRFFIEAHAVGFRAFDFIIKHRQLSIRNPVQTQHRARKCHCFYLVLIKEYRELHNV